MKKMKQSLRRLALAVMLAAVLSCCVFAAEADPATETPAQFYNAMQAHLDQREESFSIVYTGDMSELFQDPSAPGVGELLRAMSAQSTNSTGSGADYAALNVADGGIGIQGAKVYFSLEYLTSKAQETWIDQEVARLVDELNLDQEDDYTKVKLIYEYIGTNYFYDDSLEKFSAYEGLKTGTMVCQGYALLLYKMLWEAEVPSRIVTGMSQNEAHAWNIVKLGDYWYYLDVTWDARSESQDAMSWNYFLKSEEDFEGHSSFEPYRQTLYRARHPLSKTSYAAAHVTLSVDGDEVAALTIRKGVELGQAILRPQAAENILAEPDIDFVLGSMHDSPQGIDYYWMEYTSVAQCRKLIEEYLEALLELSRTDYFDSLAHMTYPLRYMRDRGGIPVDFRCCDDLVQEILKTLVERGKALELNTSGYQNPGHEPLPPEYIVKRYRELGGELITIGTDAHEPNNIAAGLEQGMELLRRCGFRYLTGYEKRKPLQQRI